MRGLSVPMETGTDTDLGCGGLAGGAQVGIFSFDDSSSNCR